MAGGPRPAKLVGEENPKNLAVNERLGEALRRRAVEDGYPTPDAYVEAVIRADLMRDGGGLTGPDPELDPETRAAIQAGLDSGPGIVPDDAFWAERHHRLAAGRPPGA